MKKKNIFLSYCWNDSNEANNIYDYFKSSRNIELHRDTIDIGKWGSIKEYMQSISDMDYTILLISDSYLKSANCMYEVLEVMRDRNYRDKIFPAVIYSGIYDPIIRIDYVKYWEDEFIRLKEKLDGLSVQNLGRLPEDLKRRQDISSNVAEFLGVVSDMNNPNIDDVCVLIEEKLSRQGFLGNNQIRDENDLMEDSGHIKENMNGLECGRGGNSAEIPIRNRADEYAQRWNKNVFLNNFNKRDRNAGVNIMLQEIYPEKHLPHYKWKSDDEEFTDLKDLLREYIVDNDDKKMLLILGQAGIGKSTLITWIMANLVEEKENILVYQFASDLRSVNWRDDNILDEIFATIDLGYNMLEGKILILDGFDEISMKENRERILHKLNQELEKKNYLRKFSLVLTCRENYVDKVELKGIEYITLQTWDETQIKSFCENYEKMIVGKDLARDNRNLEMKIGKIMEKKDIMGIPFILYMVLALNVDVERSSSTADIYDQVFSLKKGGIYDRGYDIEHRINAPEIKRHIHHISQRIAFWMFENNSNEATISQEKFEEICENEMSNYGEKSEDIQSDTLIGNFFKLKHCEGKETDEIQFVHRSIYEYFVAVYFFESLRNLKSKEEIAGKLGVLLKDGQLSLQLLEFIKYKFDNMKRNNLADITKEVFNVMLRNGMTYYFMKEQKVPSLNLLVREMNIFTNMLEIVGLWNLSLGDLNYRIVIYLRFNRVNKLKLRGINLGILGHGIQYFPKGKLRKKDLKAEDLEKMEAHLMMTELMAKSFRNEKLAGSFLKMTDLVKSYLGLGDFAGTYLREADLREADLRGVDLREADLRKANLKGANLAGANLRGVKLGEADLSETNLIGADLSGADFSWAKLSGADLRDTKLNRAILIGANLEGVNLMQADLSEANLSHSQLNKTDLSRANLVNTDLRNAQLIEVNFLDANLVEANLVKANLRGIDLSTAILKRANLTRAKLIDTNLIGAELDSTIFDDEQINLLSGVPFVRRTNVFIAETNEIISYKEYCLRKQRA